MEKVSLQSSIWFDPFRKIGGGEKGILLVADKHLEQ